LYLINCISGRKDPAWCFFYSLLCVPLSVCKSWFIMDKYLPGGSENYYLTALRGRILLYYREYVRALYFFTPRICMSGWFWLTFFIMLIYHVADFVCVDIQEHGPLRDACLVSVYVPLCAAAGFISAYTHTHFPYPRINITRRISWMQKNHASRATTKNDTDDDEYCIRRPLDGFFKK